MSTYTIKGTVKLVQQTQQISDSFKKREFVIIDDNKDYPQHINFQTVQDNTSILDGLTVGDKVEVSFNIRGREWTSPQGELRHFNSLDAWKIEKVGVDAPVEEEDPFS